MKQDKSKSKIGTIKKIFSNKLITSGLYQKNSYTELIVLMYHGIDETQNTSFNQRFFSAGNFEKHLIAFKKYFNVLSYADFVNENYSKGKTNILLTFDDGYANNYHYALPLLNKYNAHAFFFITGLDTTTQKALWADAFDIVTRYGKTGGKVTLNNIDFYLSGNSFTNPEKGLSLQDYIKTTRYPEKEELVAQLIAIYDFTKVKALDDYWQLMDDEQIYKAALSKNITIGSHGFYHNNLGALPLEEAISEVALSKKYLERIVQKEVTTIAFPDGSYTPQLNDAIYNLGFKKQFVVDYRYDDAAARDYTYDRFGLYPGMGNNNTILYKILHQ